MREARERGAAAYGEASDDARRARVGESRERDAEHELCALVRAELAGASEQLARTRCAVLGGGVSGEREVSLVSARGIASALREPDAASRWPLASVRSIELDTHGRWIVDGHALPPERALEGLGDVDVFVLGLHGGAGEDGTLQGLLHSASRAYTGSGVAASALCMDKWVARATALSAGVAVAAGELVAARAWRERDDALWRRVHELAAESGCVVKPRRGGSSVATQVLRAHERRVPHDALEAAIDAALLTRDDALVEALVDGVEITVPVLVLDGEPRALMPVEIQPRDGRFFDYEQKYASDGARECCPPENVSPLALEHARAAAVSLHALFGCGSYSRIDFIVARGGPHAGKPVFLEVNTLPGMTPRSLLPQSAAWHGIGYRDLCLCVVLGAITPVAITLGASGDAASA